MNEHHYGLLHPRRTSIKKKEESDVSSVIAAYGARLHLPKKLPLHKVLNKRCSGWKKKKAEKNHGSGQRRRRCILNKNVCEVWVNLSCRSRNDWQWETHQIKKRQMETILVSRQSESVYYLKTATLTNKKSSKVKHYNHLLCKWLKPGTSHPGTISNHFRISTVYIYGN